MEGVERRLGRRVLRCLALPRAFPAPPTTALPQIRSSPCAHTHTHTCRKLYGKKISSSTNCHPGWLPSAADWQEQKDAPQGRHTRRASRAGTHVLCRPQTENTQRQTLHGSAFRVERRHLWSSTARARAVTMERQLAPTRRFCASVRTRYLVSMPLHMRERNVVVDAAESVKAAS